MVSVASSFIEAHQGDVIGKSLQHGGLWHAPPPRGPPRQTRLSQAVQPAHEADSDATYEADPDFREHLDHEACEQGQLLRDEQTSRQIVESRP